MHILNKRVFEYSLICMIAALVGTVVTFLPDVEYQVEEPKLILLTLFNIITDNIILISSVFILFALYLKTYPLEISLRISPQKAINFVIYLHVVVLFFPPLRVIYLFVSLIILFFSTLPFNYKSSKTPFLLKFFIIWVLFSTIYGFFSMYAGIDEVRQQIPLILQLKHLFTICDGLLVYYIICKTNWGFKEFENVMKLFLYCSLVISVECIIIYHLGIYENFTLFEKPVNTVEKIYWTSRIFTSTFVEGGYHYVARIGTTMVFSSIYFFLKYRKKVYIVFFILGWILIMSTTRGVIWGTFAMVVCFCFLYLRHKMKYNYTIRPLVYFLFVVVFTTLVFTIINIGTSNRGKDFTSTTTLFTRFSLWSRAMDVFVQRPLGVGSRCSPWYQQSTSIQPIISKWYGRIAGLEYGYVGIFRTDAGVLQSDIDETKLTTVHSVILDFIVDFGVGGLLFIVLLIRSGYRHFKYILSYPKRQVDNEYWALLAIYFLMAAIFLGVLTTSKFPVFWFFAIFIAFMNRIYHYLREDYIENGIKY